MVRFSILLVNGRPRGRIHTSRGLKQSDSLMNFLFQLVVDILSWIILRGGKGNAFEDFQMGRESLTLLHFYFANDTIFFC